MSVQMFICEMSVEIFRHMNSAQDFIDGSRFVENFMSYHKLNGIQHRIDKYDSDKLEDASLSVLLSSEKGDCFVEDVPVNCHCKPQASFEIQIVSFQLFPFLLSWVTVVPCKKLIEQRHDGVDEGY